ncbi:MAG: type I DNA topoisomerase [Saprospiraceae bacterium]|nr:type I DNA topoisomerase [Saprospiraceae bacterium]
MAKNLLIVESPAKAKTIEKILGSDFTVKSSYGHIRDLDKGTNGVDIENNFKPNYVISPDKYKVVKELKEYSKKVDEVWLATDEDREGEAISWHLCQVLDLDPRITKRIVFHEITKPAIDNAVKNPRTVDLNLVDAQQARRVLDRLVGFELSEILWKKIKGGLSAGRVQSVAVKLVVERERDIQHFKISSYFKVSAIFDVKNDQGKVVQMKAEMPEKFDNESDAASFVQKCVGANYPIKNIEVKPSKRKPAAPFTTSTLQQEASRKLGFSVNRTMQNAQRLYEEGHITYMRTDSTNLSEYALQNLAQEITRSYGSQYLQTRQYKTNKANAQEAHEAIRPTYPDRQLVSQDRDQQRLYELIWKRTIASQMADAELERTVVNIGISTIVNARLVAEGEVMKFDGFLKVYLESKDEGEEEDTKGMLPPLSIGQVLPLNELVAMERFTKPAARFTEASLVKKLEELGIGRPSTYAPTISKIMEEGRGYVVKDSRDGNPRKYNMIRLKDGNIQKSTDMEMVGATKNMLYPTDMGMLVCDFLDEHFTQVMNYGFTAEIEQEFDTIAHGGKDWTKMLGKFYHPFHELVGKTIKDADRATGERLLGIDPESGRTVLVRMSKLGPVVQLGKTEELGEQEKPKYGNLKPGQSMENISFEEAMELFKLPKVVGIHADGTEITVGAGRFGPYIKYNETYISLPRAEDPLSVTLERAVELIQEKMEADKPVTIYEGMPVTKGKGRFGPFIKWNSLFINVPKKYDFDNLSQSDCNELIAAKIEKEGNRYVKVWEAEKIMIENGRWGPFIRFGKNMINLPKIDGQRATSESAAQISLEEVKKLIEAQIPDAFAPKKKAAPKKK